MRLAEQKFRKKKPGTRVTVTLRDLATGDVAQHVGEFGYDMFGVRSVLIPVIEREFANIRNGAGTFDVINLVTLCDAPQHLLSAMECDSAELLDWQGSISTLLEYGVPPFAIYWMFVDKWQDGNVMENINYRTYHRDRSPWRLASLINRAYRDRLQCGNDTVEFTAVLSQ